MCLLEISQRRASDLKSKYCFELFAKLFVGIFWKAKQRYRMSRILSVRDMGIRWVRIPVYDMFGIVDNNMQNEVVDSVTTILPILNSATTVTTTKPKDKGITIQEPSVTHKTAVSFISSSKGKAIMIESEKPVKIKDQIAHDEQVDKDLHDKIQVELEEEAKRQEEASMTTIAELYDAIQAQIYADQELVTGMTLEEHEKYIVEDRARMLAEFIKNKKKQLAVERAEAIRSKPPTKSQLRNLMMNYLKNTVNKRKKSIRMKRSSEKQKTDADLKEEEQLKTFLSIIPNEEEAIIYEVLNKRLLEVQDISRLSLKWFQVDELWKNKERLDLLKAGICIETCGS
ncbi:hypothetical protein Tco_0015623 [Tanacetum coccineum]